MAGELYTYMDDHWVSGDPYKAKSSKPTSIWPQLAGMGGGLLGGLIGSLLGPVGSFAGSMGGSMLGRGAANTMGGEDFLSGSMVDQLGTVKSKNKNEVPKPQTNLVPMYYSNGMLNSSGQGGSNQGSMGLLSMLLGNMGGFRG